MATTRRSRWIGATPQEIWRVVANPHQMPRWWPGVERVERVTHDGFTLVVPTRRGKPMRLDEHVTVSTEPSRRVWDQEVVGTPFERLLDAWTTSIELVPDGEGTIVTIVEVQQLRGSFRPGVLLQRRPARRRLDAALAALAEVL